MEKEIGIVLKTFFPKKLKMIVLDRKLGKIECVPPSDRSAVASMLEYTRSVWGSVYVIKDINILDVPLDLGRVDIQFLHHMLELCYFCAPFAQIIPGLFDLMCDLYSYMPGQLQGAHSEIKLAYIFKIVYLLGIHPDQTIPHDPLLYQLAQKPIDTIAYNALDLEVKQEMQSWVRYGLLQHPLHTYFVTTSYFHEIGS